MTGRVGLTEDRRVAWILLLLLCSVVFLFRLGALGFVDPDEPFYALTAREMLEGGDYVVPHIFGAPQFEKPVLFYWLLMASFGLLGVGELSARLVPALCGTALVLMTYGFGRRFLSPRGGLLAAIILATSLGVVTMSRTVITDPTFALFVCGGAFCYWTATRKAERSGPWICGFFALTGLAVLTKGPLGSLVPLLAIVSYRIVARAGTPGTRLARSAGILTYAAIVGPWYGMMLAKFGVRYFDAFFVHENLERLYHAEHPGNNHWYYYLMVLALGLIPWMPVLGVLVSGARRRSKDPTRLFLWCWVLSSLLFFTIVQSKLPTYVFFLFVPLALLMGHTLDRLLRRGFASLWEQGLFVGLGLVQATALLATPWIVRPEGRPFLVPLLAAGTLLVLATWLNLRRPCLAGVALTGLGSVALLVLVYSVAAPAIEELTSVRPAVPELLAKRVGDEPIITDPLLVRGVAYYTRQPVTVLSDKKKPFWSPQAVPVLVGSAALDNFLAEDSSAVCLLRPDEWQLARSAERWRANPLYLGLKVVARLDGDRAPRRATPLP